MHCRSDANASEDIWNAWPLCRSFARTDAVIKININIRFALIFAALTILSYANDMQSLYDRSTWHSLPSWHFCRSIFGVQQLSTFSCIRKEWLTFTILRYLFMNILYRLLIIDKIIRVISYRASIIIWVTLSNIDV